MDAASHSLDAAILCVENVDNTDYDSNMHIAPVRYIANNFDLVLCTHFKKRFFSINFSSNRM